MTLRGEEKLEVLREKHHFLARFSQHICRSILPHLKHASPHFSGTHFDRLSVAHFDKLNVALFDKLNVTLFAVYSHKHPPTSQARIPALFWYALRQAQCSTFRQAQCSDFRSIFAQVSSHISSTHLTCHKIMDTYAALLLFASN